MALRGSRRTFPLSLPHWMSVCLLHLAFSVLRKLPWRFPGFKRTTYPTDCLLFFLQLINKEEELLEKEKSSFPLLQTLMINKVPFEQLWVTAYEFSTKSEEWMNGRPSSNPARTRRGRRWGWCRSTQPARKSDLLFGFQHSGLRQQQFIFSQCNNKGRQETKERDTYFQV